MHRTFSDPGVVTIDIGDAIAVDEPNFLMYLLATHKLDIDAQLFGYRGLSGSYLAATCLHFAVYRGSVRCVERLLAEGASRGQKDDGGMTPLQRLDAPRHPEDAARYCNNDDAIRRALEAAEEEAAEEEAPAVERERAPY